MTFVHPLFLWALAAVAVPIIIHLFNLQKYKKVYFTNVKFLRELQHESKSKSRLKEILVLICRCLFIICLVLAFCQPLLPDANQAVSNPGAKALSIYIDNSFSMQNVTRQGPLLEIARLKAKELVKALENNDRIQVLTNDFEGRHQRFHSKDDALKVIDEVKASSGVRPVSEVLQRQSAFLNSSGLKNKMIYLFSDAQKSTFDLNTAKPDTGIRTTILPLVANRVNNVFIDTCWFESPVQQKGFIQKLHARIINHGNTNIDAGSAKLFLNKQQIALASFTLGAGSTREVLFTFECKQASFNYGSVKIEDYPVTFDDELFFAFNSRLNVAVTVVNGADASKATYFNSLFGRDSLFSYTSFDERTIDYGAFKRSDVIILNQPGEMGSGLLSELLKFTSQGGALVIIPSKEVKDKGYEQALAALQLPLMGAVDSVQVKTDPINPNSDFFIGVFEKIEERTNLPVLFMHHKLFKNSRSDFEPLLRLQNGDDFMGRTRLNNSTIFLFSAPLEEGWTNFPKHALFVPTFYRICFNGLKALPLFYPVSANEVINLRNDALAAEQPPHIKSADKTIDIIPQIRVVNNSLSLFTRDQLTLPGFYEVNRNNQALLPLAFNFSRKESLLEAYTADELQKIIGEKGWRSFTVAKDAQGENSGEAFVTAGGKKLWKLFIILALIFIFIETALLRLLR